jgi:hypothetical protein
MKWVLPAALLPCIVLAGCDNRRISDLDQRVKALEQSVKQLQSAQRKIGEEESKRHTQLQVCIFEANSKFQGSLDRNGKRRGDGTYDVPAATMAEMERQKRDEVEQCKVLYGN